MLKTNSIEALTRQIRLQQQTLDDVITTINKMDRLVSDATALQARLKTGGAEIGRGEDLAALLLAASAYSTWSSVPVNLDLQLEPLSAGASPDDQIRRLDSLLTALRERRQSLQSESNVSLEQQVRELSAQLEQQNAEKAKLESERDLAKTSYSTLLSKLAEMGISDASPTTVVRVAITAAPPDEPGSPKPILSALIASFFGLVLGLVLAVVFGFFKEPRERVQGGHSSSSSTAQL